MFTYSFAICAALLAQQSWAETCSKENVIAIPSGRPNISNPETEAGLQIYNSLVIPCDGVIKQWGYLTKYPTVSPIGAHFAVFRQVSPTQWLKKGDTHVTKEQFPEAGWNILNAEEPIEVERGDVLGLYYDDFSVASISVGDGDHAGPTVVWMKNAKNFADEGNVLDLDSAHVHQRVAGLIAAVSAPGSAPVTSTSRTTFSSSWSSYWTSRGTTVKPSRPTARWPFFWNNFASQGVGNIDWNNIDWDNVDWDKIDLDKIDLDNVDVSQVDQGVIGTGDGTKFNIMDLIKLSKLKKQ